MTTALCSPQRDTADFDEPVELRLTGSEFDDADDLPPLGFERRRYDRWEVDTAATAFHVAGEAFGRMHGLRVIDYSQGGLGAMSDDPIAPGTIVSLGFASPGLLARRGEVTRCLPCGDGYRVGIMFQQRLAA